MWVDFRSSTLTLRPVRANFSPAMYWQRSVASVSCARRSPVVAPYGVGDSDRDRGAPRETLAGPGHGGRNPKPLQTVTDEYWTKAIDGSPNLFGEGRALAMRSIGSLVNNECLGRGAVSASGNVLHI